MQCRLCGGEEETLTHLMNSCSHTASVVLRRPVDVDLILGDAQIMSWKAPLVAIFGLLSDSDISSGLRGRGRSRSRGRGRGGRGRTVSDSSNHSILEFFSRLAVLDGSMIGGGGGGGGD